MLDKKKLPQQTSIKYLYNTRKYLFWAGFLGLLMAGLLVFALLPQLSSSSEIYNDLIASKKKLALLKIKSAQLNEFAGSLLVSNESKINDALPSKKPLLELLSGLSLVGEKTQVLFTELSLAPGKISTPSAQLSSAKSTRSKKSPAQYDVLSLDVTVTGKIDNVNQFLKEIEKIAPFSTIVALTLNEKSNRNQTTNNFAENVFEAKITIATYFFTKEIKSNINSSLQEDLLPSEREAIKLLQDFTYPSLEQQLQIKGGGLEDLFPGVDNFSGLTIEQS